MDNFNSNLFKNLIYFSTIHYVLIVESRRSACSAFRWSEYENGIYEEV